MSDLLRRFRFPLVYLLLASVCVATMASRRGPAELGFASRLVLRVTLPLERMVTVPVQEAQGFWDRLVELVRVREENERLRDDLVRLRDENLQFREALVSSERFRRLAGFRASRRVPMVPANVVHQDLSPWFKSIVIDQGALTRIRAGMPVITDSGVVGVVSGTTPGASKVLLLTDPQSRIDAYVQRSRARGSVRGESERECGFDYVLREDDVQAGDLLLTSGLGSVFPKGLVVGRVSEVDRKPYGLFQRARIEPAVDFRKLEEVFVILDHKDIPPDSAFSEEDSALWAPAAPAPESGAEPRPAPDTPAAGADG